MPWYGIAVIIYCVIEAVLHVAYVGKSVPVRPGGAVLTLFTQAGIIAAVIALASH